MLLRECEDLIDWASDPRISSVVKLFPRGILNGDVGESEESVTVGLSETCGVGTNMVFRTSRRPLLVPTFR